MKITLEDRKTNKRLAELYKRLYSVHNHIKNRTSNPKDTAYKNYGAKGIRLDDSWKSFDDFLSDIDSVDGWDEDKFLNKEIQLDKDIKVKGNKVYRKDTTTWIPLAENMTYRPSRNPTFYAYNEYTQEIEKSDSPYYFEENHGFNHGGVNGVLYGRKHRKGDWWLWLESDKPPVPQRYHFVTREGEHFWDVNPRRLSEKMGRDPRYMNNVLTKKIPNGTKAWVEDIDLQPLVNDYESNSK